MRGFMLGGDIKPLPCPFCGADVAIIDRHLAGQYFVLCVDCCATGPVDERETAVIKWNGVAEVLDAVKAETGLGD